jgi:hypothetical protein
VNSIKLILTVSFITFFIGSTFTQSSFEWVSGNGGANYQQSESVAIDSTGNIYYTGYYQSTMDLDPGTGVDNVSSAGGYDVFVIKLDPQGNYVWGRSFGGIGNDKGHSLTVDNAGNVYTTGYFSETSDFDPGPGVDYATVLESQDFFIHKLNSNGDYIWAKTIENFGYGGGQDIVFDPNGFLYLTGAFEGIADFDLGPGVYNMGTVDYNLVSFILKLDLDGNFLWAKENQKSGTGQSDGNAINVDNSGNVYTTGYFQNSIDFDPGAGTQIFVANVLDSYVQKLNSNGDLVWVKTFGGSGSERGHDITIDNSGNVYSVGQFAGTVDFDPNAGVNNITTAASSSRYVQKLDQNGNFGWAFELNSLIAITTDDYGNIYTTGTFSGTVDFDFSAGVSNLTSNNIDVFVQKMDSNGGLISVISTEASASGIAAGYSVAVNKNGNIAVSGIFENTVDFDPEATTDILPWLGAYDVFVIKYSQCEFEVNPDLVLLSDITDECSVSAPTAPLATNCLGSYSGVPDIVFPITTQGTTVVTWTYTNTFGLTETQTQNVVITDATAPVADIGTLSDVNAQCSVPSLTAATATDNCVGSVIGTHNATFPITSTTLVTWTYDDGNGNTSSQTQNVVINDNTSPVADAGSLSDINGACFVNSLIPPTATDNCIGTVTGTTSTSLPITTQGTTVVTWTYDDGNGNTSTQTQSVTINDATAPVADNAILSDVTAACEVTNLTAPTATDNCAGAITGTHNATLPITAQGTTTVTWTYDDGNGNTSSQTQNVVITDVTPPVLDLITLPNITSECSVTSLTPPTATDNCVGSVTGTNNVTLPITAQGTTVVTWTYDDGNGNTSTQTQNVIITDAVAPVADLGSLAPVTAECQVTSVTAPTATDNCVGSITGTHNATLPITAQGTTTVTWTYDDGNGNTTTQTQDIVITDATEPTADLANLAEVNSECDVTPTAPTGTDNCAGAITGTPDVTFPITASGTTTITWTYDDGNGNTSTQTQDVILTPIDNGITQVDPITLRADATGYTYQWVNCNNGNAPVPGATSQSFTPTIAGNYACIVDNGTCSVTTACLSSTVGITEIWDTELVEVYPNPTSGNLKIDLGGVYNGTTVKVFNALGQVVIKESFGSTDEINLDIDGTPGMYILEIKTDEGKSARVNVIKK